MAIRARFKPTAEGEFHPGIPARNLDDDDFAALDNDQRKTVRESRLYAYVKREPRQPSGQRATDTSEPEGVELDSDHPDDTPTETPEDFAAVAAEEGQGF